MAESLLAHLYSRIKGSQEDVATLSLQYIISSNEKLNEAFNRMICDATKKDIGTDITYSCQSVGKTVNARICQVLIRKAERLFYAR